VGNKDTNVKTYNHIVRYKRIFKKTWTVNENMNKLLKDQWPHQTYAINDSSRLPRCSLFLRLFRHLRLHFAETRNTGKLNYKTIYLTFKHCYLNSSRFNRGFYVILDYAIKYLNMVGTDTGVNTFRMHYMPFVLAIFVWFYTYVFLLLIRLILELYFIFYFILFFTNLFMLSTMLFMVTVRVSLKLLEISEDFFGTRHLEAEIKKQREQLNDFRDNETFLDTLITTFLPKELHTPMRILVAIALGLFDICIWYLFYR
jgi:hypothetical protein